MRQSMMDMMVAMMPYMMPLVWLGGILIVVGIISVLTCVIGCSAIARSTSWLSGTLLILLGVFFLGSQVAGMLLGANPSINFGDASQYEFNLKPFWMVGLIFLIPGILIRAMRGSRK
ncbi:MAG: transporter [Alphaproteobacteria bacterium]